MRFVRGFPSTMMDEYQLNITNILRHAATNFPEREVVSRTWMGACSDTAMARLTREFQDWPTSSKSLGSMLEIEWEF